MTSSVRVSEVIDVASNLAIHNTKLVGGVAWEPVAPQLRVSTPRMVAVSVVSRAVVGACEAELRTLIDQDPHVGVARNDGSCIGVRLLAAGPTLPPHSIVALSR